MVNLKVFIMQTPLSTLLSRPLLLSIIAVLRNGGGYRGGRERRGNDYF